MAPYIQETTAPLSLEMDQNSLTELFALETRIARNKLETLAAEIHGRIWIHGNNLNRIERDKETASAILERLDRAARYHLREHSDKSQFYRILFGLEQERRTEDVECWRDVVQVMRDFLQFWEAHERIKAKGRLFADA